MEEGEGVRSHQLAHLLRQEKCAVPCQALDCLRHRSCGCTSHWQGTITTDALPSSSFIALAHMALAFL